MNVLRDSTFSGLANRTRCAFEFSFETLRERNKRLYFWSFTPEQKISDRLYAKCWHHFMARLWMYLLPVDFEALRTFERWQDGFLHGHMVCNRRLPVRLVRAYAARTGIGWMHASEAGQRSGEYMAKYLGKGFDRGMDSERAIRHWAPIGKWPHTRVADIKIEMNPPNPMSYFLEKLKGQRGAFSMAKQYCMAVAFGEIPNPLVVVPTADSALSVI